MKFIISRISASFLLTLMLIVINCKISHNKKRKKLNISTESYVIRFPETVLCAGVADVLFYSFYILFMICFPIYLDSVWVFVLCGAFILLGVYIIFKTLRFKVEVFTQKNYFLYRNFFKTEIVTYDNCKYYEVTKNLLKIRIGNKDIILFNKSVNMEFLFEKFEEYNVKNIDHILREKKIKN